MLRHIPTLKHRLEIFSPENQTFEQVGNFKKYNGRYFIDLNNLTTSYYEYESIYLSPYEVLTYSFTIQNAEEGKYRIAMYMAIMNMQSLAQSFAQSNAFNLTI